jgi:hypothetical protein
LHTERPSLYTWGEAENPKVGERPRTQVTSRSFCSLFSPCELVTIWIPEATLLLQLPTRAPYHALPLMALNELLLFRFPDAPTRLASSCTHARPVMSATPAVNAPLPATSRQVAFEFGLAGIPSSIKVTFASCSATISSFCPTPLRVQLCPFKSFRANRPSRLGGLRTGVGQTSWTWVSPYLSAH